MSDDSIIRHSRQSWKVMAFLVGTISGAALIWIARLALPAGAMSAVLMLLGAAIAIASFAIGIVAIRCPQCRARWWLATAASQRGCPKCSYPG